MENKLQYTHRETRSFYGEKFLKEKNSPTESTMEIVTVYYNLLNLQLNNVHVLDLPTPAIATNCTNCFSS